MKPLKGKGLVICVGLFLGLESIMLVLSIRGQHPEERPWKELSRKVRVKPLRVGNLELAAVVVNL